MWNDPGVISGRGLFASAGCALLRRSAMDAQSHRLHAAPSTGLISNTQLIGQLRKVGTFNPAAFNKVCATAAAPLGGDGFSPGSLLSLSAFPQTFFHNGAANSLGAVLGNITHRSAGTGASTR